MYLLGVRSAQEGKLFLFNVENDQYDKFDIQLKFLGNCSIPS